MIHGHPPPPVNFIEEGAVLPPVGEAPSGVVVTGGEVALPNVITKEDGVESRPHTADKAVSFLVCKVHEGSYTGSHLRNTVWFTGIKI